MFCSTTQAWALEIPIEQTENMIDGRQTLVKVFEVTPDVDPETLIEDDFDQNGYTYSMTSIVKSSVVVRDETEVTQEHSVTVSVSNENSARLEALLSMPSFIEYDQEGYTGKLYPVPSSLTGVEAGRKSGTNTKTITRSYTYSYNDDSLVPKTVDGYSLSSISWSEGSYMADSAIPDSYVATATYSKKSSYSTVTGWTFTMTYVGDVEYEAEDTIRYTITYTGELIPEPIVIPEEEPTFFEKLFGSKKGSTSTVSDSGISSSDSSGSSSGEQGSAGRTILGILCAMIAVASVAAGIYLLLRTLGDNKVAIYARDELSGEFSQVKTVGFKSKSSSVTIDPSIAPQSQHFRASFNPTLAERLKGKVVTVKAGTRIIKHQIGDAGGADYVIEVSLEDPSSTFV